MQIKRLLRGAILGAALVGAGLAGPALASDGPHLTAFGSAAELNALLDARAPQDGAPVDPKCRSPNPEDCRMLDEIVITGSRMASGPTITNNQEVGVDEGDIVKARGDLLVILRRGRLFSVSTAGGGLRAVDRIDAYAPGIDPDEDWYDEMLISGDWVVVIGYSYGRGGTEINRFRMDAAGRFTFVDTHHLTSDDYYSSRNYASRLIGEELVLYSPVGIRRYYPETDPRNARDPLENLPRLARWTVAGPDGEGEAGEGLAIVAATDVYRSPYLDDPKAEADTLHTVIRCDLTAIQLACRGTVIVGPESRNFYVAPEAVYVWMAADRWNMELPKDRLPPAWLYRIPLNGQPPVAAATQGVPIDQFSFREDPDARRIDVMLVSEGRGEGMWGSESARGHAALLSLSFDRFGDGREAPDEDDYRILPSLPEDWEARNRFVGRHLLYSGLMASRYGGEREQGLPEEEGVLTVVPLDGGPIARFVLPGQIGRIEEMGRDAMVVTDFEGLIFTTVGLEARAPLIRDQFFIPAASESESRSHAFHFLSDADSPDGARGVLGLPIFRAHETLRDRYDDPLEVGAVAFMRRGEGRLSGIGSLDAAPAIAQVDDGCEASCYSWYGDARPIFLNGRVFALLGYEIVEGRERNGRIRELRRVNITPPTPSGPRPYYLDD